MIPPERIGRYHLRGEIGHGAMGAVFRAHDPQLARDVAVKLISLAYAAGHGDPKEAAARFAREARVAARLHHPNVVGVYDFGEEGDQLFLVMELVAGDTLAQRLARGEFPGTTAALQIVAQTADALAAAHLAGVIHRDIKPGNLLLSPAGNVKVSDFGVAKAVGESTELTRTGMMVGSPAYMAPEQVQGMELDGRSDLFSLGVVLYEMLMHRKPFPADTLTTLVYQILHQDPFDSETVAGRLHPDLIDLLRWSLDKERDVRIPDAVTFAARARALAAQFARASTAAPLPAGCAAAAAADRRRRRSSGRPPRRRCRCRRRATPPRRRPRSSAAPAATGGAGCPGSQAASCWRRSSSDSSCASPRRRPIWRRLPPAKERAAGVAAVPLAPAAGPAAAPARRRRGGDADGRGGSARRAGAADAGGRSRWR